MKKPEDIEDKNLTIGSLIKIVVAVVFVIGWTVAIYAYMSSISTRLELLKQENAIQHAAVDARLADLVAGARRNEQVQAELIRAIDRTSVLLEQVHKQLERK